MLSITRGGACRALTTIRCKNLTVRLRSARRDATISFIFAVRTARCEGRPWYPQRAERAAACGAVPAARRIIFFIKSDYHGSVQATADGTWRPEGYSLHQMHPPSLSIDSGGAKSPSWAFPPSYMRPVA